MSLANDNGAELAEALPEEDARETEEARRDLARQLLALPQGLHEHVPESVYHARVLGLANKGGLDKILESPATHKAWIDYLVEDDDTPALAFGSGFHMDLLENDRFLREYAVEPLFGDCRAVEGRTTKEQGKRNKEERDNWRIENAGKKLISSDDAVKMARMREVVLAHPLHGSVTIGETLERAQTEITARWRDTETGLEGKCRGDLWLEAAGWLLDVKTTSSACPDAEEFSRICGNFAYFRAASWYPDGFIAAGAEVTRFAFIVISKVYPHLCKVHELDEAGVAFGRSDNRRALRTLAKCIATDTWPALEGGIHPFSLKPWVFR